MTERLAAKNVESILKPVNEIMKVIERVKIKACLLVKFTPIFFLQMSTLKNSANKDVKMMIVVRQAKAMVTLTINLAFGPKTWSAMIAIYCCGSTFCKTAENLAPQKTNDR